MGRPIILPTNVFFFFIDVKIFCNSKNFFSHKEDPELIHRRYRNRIAAAKCRQKKNEKVAELERTIQDLSTIIKEYHAKCCDLETRLSCILQQQQQESHKQENQQQQPPPSLDIFQQQQHEQYNSIKQQSKEEQKDYLNDFVFDQASNFSTNSTASSSSTSTAWQLSPAGVAAITAFEKKTCLYTIF